MGNQEELNNELEKLLEDTKMLLKTIEVKREQVSEGATDSISKLNSIVKVMEQENVSLQSLPKKVAKTIHELLPSIVTQLDQINEQKIKKYIQDLSASTQQHNVAIKDSAFRLKEIKDEIVQIDSKRIKRYFLGFGFTMLISVLASLGASYVMMVKFPQHVQISDPSNVNVENSQVSFWSSKNVNISGDTKQRKRK